MNESTPPRLDGWLLAGALLSLYVLLGQGSLYKVDGHSLLWLSKAGATQHDYHTFYLPGLEAEALLHRVLNPLLSWSIGRLVYATREESRRLSRAGRERLRVDLLDRRAAVPIVRQGLLNALLCVGLFCIAALATYDFEAAPALGLALAVLLPLSALLAGSLLRHVSALQLMDPPGQQAADAHADQPVRKHRSFGKVDQGHRTLDRLAHVGGILLPLPRLKGSPGRAGDTQVFVCRLGLGSSNAESL